MIFSLLLSHKIDCSFLSSEFYVDGYSKPFRCDRNKNGGGVIIFIREDIPCKALNKHIFPTNMEGLFIEINLRKVKWLFFGGYNPRIENISYFLTNLGTAMDLYTRSYENILILGDFNSQNEKNIMGEFCQIYNLKNMINEPTCFKNPLNPSSIDVILTNKTSRFSNNCTLETGISDHHKMTITVLKTFFSKQAPVTITYRNYKNFDKKAFHNELSRNLGNIADINYDTFEDTFMDQLNKHAPIKSKIIRANNAPFMNKIL